MIVNDFYGGRLLWQLGIRMLRVLMRELCSLVLIHGCTTLVSKRQYVDCKRLCNGFANGFTMDLAYLFICVCVFIFNAPGEKNGLSLLKLTCIFLISLFSFRISHRWHMWLAGRYIYFVWAITNTLNVKLEFENPGSFATRMDVKWPDNQWLFVIRCKLCSVQRMHTAMKFPSIINYHGQICVILLI